MTMTLKGDAPAAGSAQVETQQMLAMAIHAFLLVDEMRDFSARSTGWIAEEGRVIASALHVWISVATRSSRTGQARAAAQTPACESQGEASSGWSASLPS